MAHLYLRLSQDRSGQSLGIDRQRELCTALCERLGWTIEGEYVDRDISAWTGKRREQYEQLLTDLRGRKVSAVVAYAPDRLYRRIKELDRLIDAVNAGRADVACVQAGSVDLSTAVGRANARHMATGAQLESDLKSERLKATYDQYAAMGKPHGGMRAFGWELDRVTPREDEAERLRRAYAYVLDGGALTHVCEEWNAAGVTTVTGKRWTPTTLRRTLLRDRHRGKAVHDGEAVSEGQWPAIVDEQTWLGVHALLTKEGRRVSPGNKVRWLLSGIATCGECGSVVSASGVTSRGVRYMVYRCRETGKHVGKRIDLVDSYVEGFIHAMLNEPGHYAVFSPPNTADVDALRREHASLAAQLEEAKDLWRERVLTADDLRSTTARLTARQTEIDETIAAMSPALEGMPPPLEISRKWKSLPMERRREVIRRLISVTLLKTEHHGRKRFDPSTVEIVTADGQHFRGTWDPNPREVLTPDDIAHGNLRRID